jgi:hypothetical protein
VVEGGEKDMEAMAISDNDAPNEVLETRPSDEQTEALRQFIELTDEDLSADLVGGPKPPSECSTDG